jgi:hypothetical protein
MKIARTIAISALWFLCISAIVGAVPLILYPRGKPWGYMTQEMLKYSHFHSYLIPGLILLLTNGVLCLFVISATARNRPGYGWWVAFQGCVAAGWIVVEMILLRVAAWPQYLYLAVGVVLIAAGLALTRKTRPASR